MPFLVTVDGTPRSSDGSQPIEFSLGASETVRFRQYVITASSN